MEKYERADIPEDILRNIFHANAEGLLSEALEKQSRTLPDALSGVQSSRRAGVE
jgi:hypothetical protein